MNMNTCLKGVDHMFSQWEEGGKEQMIEFVAERLYVIFKEDLAVWIMSQLIIVQKQL